MYFLNVYVQIKDMWSKDLDLYTMTVPENLQLKKVFAKSCFYFTINQYLIPINSYQLFTTLSFFG